MLILATTFGCTAPAGKEIKPHTLGDLDSLFSSKPLGCSTGRTATTFRLFAPRATAVKVVLFDRADADTGAEYSMTIDADGVWEFEAPPGLYGKFYGYRLFNSAAHTPDHGKGNGGGNTDRLAIDSGIVIADPYSRAVATENTYLQPAKSLIIDGTYDWEGDTWVIPANHTQLIIYEAHVRDLTAHSSSGVSAAGTYKGLVEHDRTGGLAYLQDLGINAIELLPIQKFGTIELPYRDSATVKTGGVFNTWNPYERNHWGYMTSYFFAPETYYATGGTLERGKWSGTDARAVTELKDMVKELHRKGIAVVLDVVFNHVSQYDRNPYKLIDKAYYFRLDSAGNYLSASGCGNDFKTERKMSRRMIIDCIKYWMSEYHIDGFRFDLAAMIDLDTRREILEEAKTINPNVLLIAEPWGGGKYEPAEFSGVNWAAWNDRIRNGVKGQNPNPSAPGGLGFIFGKFQGDNTAKNLRSYVTGTLKEDGGLFQKAAHAINYLESHDDHTMSDFIRLGLGDVKEAQRITDVEKHARLTPKQLALHKLAALYLFTSQGAVMIHEGQEFGRSKVIAPTTVDEKKVGMIDHNSYEKDDETNYLNYNHATLNRELFSYYRGLIEMRRKFSDVFGSAAKSKLTFLETPDEWVLAYRITRDSTERAKNFIVILNGNPAKSADLALPAGKWSVIANGKTVTLERTLGSLTAKVLVPPSSGMILVDD